MADVLERGGLEVVEADARVPALEQRLAKMGAEESGAAGHQGSRHPGDGSSDGGGLHEPVLDAEARYALEVAHVPRDQREVASETDRRDPQVGILEALPGGLELHPNLSVGACRPLPALPPPPRGGAAPPLPPPPPPPPPPGVVLPARREGGGFPGGGRHAPTLRFGWS